jgi:hypothetical protein
MKRIALYLLAFAVALVAPAHAADAEWMPDQALISKIETAFAPIVAAGLTDIGDHPVKARALLKDYNRYYAGETTNGEKVVVGSFTFGSIWGGTPGVHIVTMKELPSGFGGGCGMIHIWYHVATGKIESVCNITE